MKVLFKSALFFVLMHGICFAQVGIGTSSPVSKLEVVGGGSTSSSSSLSVKNSSTASLLHVRDDGNVGIGTDAPSGRLQIVGNGTISNGMVVTSHLNTNAASKYGFYTVLHHTNSEKPLGLISGESFYHESTPASYVKVGGGFGEVNAATSIGFYTASNTTTAIGNLRMFIKSDGNVGIGTDNPEVPLDISTSNSTGLRITSTNSDNNGILTLDANTNANFTGDFHEFIYFKKQGVAIGRISSNGSSNVSYGTSSDFRLKKDFRDFDATKIISEMKVYDYAWKSDNTRMFGFIAHELQSVVPYLVSGEKDAVDDQGKPKYQMVDYSKVTPILVKALQEQHDVISSQQRRIEELEKKMQILLDQKR
jgi:Chaperone of endosialidase